MRLRSALVVLLAATSLVLPATAAARVRVVGVTSPIDAGDYATLTLSVTPRATCSITVNYKSGPSHARGLTPKRASGGRVSWTWRVGTNTTPGTWGIDVSCGAAGSLRTSFRVR